MLRLENKRLLELLSDPFISGLHYTAHGGLEVDAEAPAAALMAGMFMGMFERSPDAKNYIECRFSSTQGTILVTVTRPGGKTPHELRREAEAKLAEYLKTPNAHHHPPEGPTARVNLSVPGWVHDVVGQSLRSWYEFARFKQASSEAPTVTPTPTANQTIRRNASAKL